MVTRIIGFTILYIIFCRYQTLTRNVKTEIKSHTFNCSAMGLDEWSLYELKLNCKEKRSSNYTTDHASHRKDNVFN